jgi:hypothetical protein
MFIGKGVTRSIKAQNKDPIDAINEHSNFKEVANEQKV